MGRWTTRKLMAGTAAVALILALVPALPAPLMAIGRLGLGWLALLVDERAPRVAVRPGALAGAAGALVLGGVAVHLIGRRWAARRPDDLAPWRPAWTIRALGGAAALVVAGLAAAGLLNQAGHLLFDGEPWWQHPHGRSPHLRSASNLRQIGLGLSQYANIYDEYPSGATFDARGTPLHGWPTLILPYVDQVELHQAIDLARPWDDERPNPGGPSNRAITQTIIGTYRLPGTGPIGPVLGYATNAWVIGGDRPRPLASITDGLGATILAGEAAGDYRPWGSPVHWRDPGRGINRGPAGFGGPFPGGANFLFADGSVRFLSDRTPLPVFRALATPDGGERVDPAKLGD